MAAGGGACIGWISTAAGLLGGASVSPGDVIVGNADGVVVVPHELGQSCRRRGQSACREGGPHTRASESNSCTFLSRRISYEVNRVDGVDAGHGGVGWSAAAGARSCTHARYAGGTRTGQPRSDPRRRRHLRPGSRRPRRAAPAAAARRSTCRGTMPSRRAPPNTRHGR